MPRMVILMAGVLLAVLVVSSSAQEPSDDGGGSRRGWTIPAGAAKEPNPIEATPEVIEAGKKIYADNCEKCHGATGKGDGPDADPDAPPDDLTDPARAKRNPDGVMFYKIWNGRRSPKMPAFKSEGLTKEQVWQVIHYIKTFREPAA
ncbi:MAG TPA: cytochrome c [Vicinamibacterales bacterium]